MTAEPDPAVLLARSLYRQLDFAIRDLTEARHRMAKPRRV